MKRSIPVGVMLFLGTVLVFLSPEGLPFSILSLMVGLVIVFLIGDPMVEGLKEFGI